MSASDFRICVQTIPSINHWQSSLPYPPMSASPSSFSSPLSSSILFIKHQNITPHIFEYPVALLYPSQVIQRNTAGSEYQVHCAPVQQQQQLLCAPVVAQSQWGPPSKRQKQSQPQPIFNCLSLNFRDRNQPHCVGGWCHPVVLRWSANLVWQHSFLWTGCSFDFPITINPTMILFTSSRMLHAAGCPASISYYTIPHMHFRRYGGRTQD